MSGGITRNYGGGLDARVTRLEQKDRALDIGAAKIAAIGTFTLSTGAATSTAVSDSTVTASSLIFYIPSNADAWSLDGALNGITTAAGSFTVSHPASSLTRSYKYIVINAA